MNQVLFDNISSYDDLGLWLTDVNIGLPEPRRITVDVPGRNGVLDLTYSLTPSIRFKNRKIKLTFQVANYQYEWLDIFSNVMNALHGKTFHNVRIQPDDYYWDVQMCTVDSAHDSKNVGTIKVTLDCYPYKLSRVATRYQVSPTPQGKHQICSVTGMDVKPTFLTGGSGTTVTFGNVTHELERLAENSFNDIVLTEGNNDLIITGDSDIVHITYYEGIL